MENPFGVRHARPGDEDTIFDHLLMLHAENGLAPVSEAKVRAEIRCATNGDGNIIGVIDGGNGIEASTGLGLRTFWYSDKFHWEELWIFVHPRHRRTNHAQRLIGFVKWCRDETSRLAGEDINLFVGILTLRQVEPKIRLYQRSFPQVGASFAYGVVPQGAFSQRRIVAPPGDGRWRGARNGRALAGAGPTGPTNGRE